MQSSDEFCKLVFSCLILVGPIKCEYFGICFIFINFVLGLAIESNNMQTLHLVEELQFLKACGIITISTTHSGVTSFHICKSGGT